MSLLLARLRHTDCSRGCPHLAAKRTSQLRARTSGLTRLGHWVAASRADWLPFLTAAPSQRVRLEASMSFSFRGMHATARVHHTNRRRDPRRYLLRGDRPERSADGPSQETGLPFWWKPERG